MSSNIHTDMTWYASATVWNDRKYIEKGTNLSEATNRYEKQKYRTTVPIVRMAVA